MRDIEYFKKIESLKIMIKSIQIVKDQLQLILNAFDESLDSNSSIKSFIKARENLVACYEENSVNFSKEEDRIPHAAKGKVLAAEKIIVKGLKNKEWVSSLPKDDKEKLIVFRRELSELQEQLRDFLMDKFTRFFNE